MKKIILVVFVIFSFASCDLFNPPASVRFQNLMTDGFSFNYGIKYGDAVHNGALINGTSTSYYSTEAGSYSIQAKTMYGDWLTISNGSHPVVSGGTYTISVMGTADYYYFQFIED